MAQNKKCACCEEETITAGSIYEICPVCGWEDDELQNEDPTFAGGANDMSLNEAKQAYQEGKRVY